MSIFKACGATSIGESAITRYIIDLISAIMLLPIVL